MIKIKVAILARAAALFTEETEMSDFPFNFGFLDDDEKEAQYNRLAAEGDVDMNLSKVTATAVQELANAMYQDYILGNFDYDKTIWEKDGWFYDMYHAAQYGNIIDGYFEKRFNDLAGIGNQLELTL